MLLISPNCDVKSIIFFPILARGLFPKLLKKDLMLVLPRAYYRNPQGLFMLSRVCTHFLCCCLEETCFRVFGCTNSEDHHMLLSLQFRDVM